MLRSAVLLLSAFTLSAPAFAEDAPKADKNDPNRQICRRQDATGSIMGVKVCHTKAEWDAIRKSAGSGATSVRNRDAVDSTTFVKPGAG
jgi:hypothetical protein